MYNWYQLVTQHSYIHECVLMYSLFMALPLKNPSLLLTWRPPAVMRVVLSSPRLLVNCLLVPHCSPLFLASLPPGFPRNPNVLLIRTHPNPLPSVANSYDEAMNYWCRPLRQATIYYDVAMINKFWP
jgi:hypothetical protein